MANTMTKIASITASGSTTQIAFTLIPQTYTDLVLKVSSRSAATTVSAILIVFNGDTSTFYSTTRLLGNGSTAASDRFTAQSYGSVYNNAQDISTYTSNVYAVSNYYILNYANTTSYKSYLIDGVSENGATTSYQNLLSGSWQKTSNIYQINVLDANGTNLTSSSEFTLYGI
jgi:hypothetical protein